MHRSRADLPFRSDRNDIDIARRWARALQEPKQVFDLDVDIPKGERKTVNTPKAGIHFEPGVLPVPALGRSLGSDRAKHHVVEFTDFFCHHCQRAHDVVSDVIMKEYAPAGIVRFESHPVAFLDDDSLRAAHAALCAQEQHKCESDRTKPRRPQPTRNAMRCAWRQRTWTPI